MKYMMTTLKLQDLYGWQRTADIYQYSFNLPILEDDDILIMMLDMCHDNDCKIFKGIRAGIKDIVIVTPKRAQDTQIILIIKKK